MLSLEEGFLFNPPLRLEGEIQFTVEWTIVSQLCPTSLFILLIVWPTPALSLMDLKVEFKEEPVWLEDTANISFNSELNNGVDNEPFVKIERQTLFITPKVENDSRTEDDTVVPSATVKDEIFIEEHVVAELVPYIKGENNVEDVGTLTTGSVLTCGGSGQALLRQCNLLTQGDETPHYSSGCGSIFSQERYDKSLSLTDSMEKSYICNICKRTFSQKFRFNDHLLSHSRPHQCNVCNKTFARKAHLVKHMLSHTTEGSFSCNICNKKLKAKDTLKRHMTLHSGERPFICTVCSRNFRTKRDVTEHVAIHSAEKPFVCKSCKNAFALKSYLMQHMAIHSAEKPFVCNSCKKAFTLKSGLKRHMAIHSGEKPFVCNSCKKAFTQKSGLRRHMAIHSAEKPFVCNSCKKAFARKSGLRQHMKAKACSRDVLLPSNIQTAFS